MSTNTSPNTELIQKLQAKAPAIVPGKVLVAHYRLHPNSSDLDTATIKHQFYSPEVYDEYVREESREGGKQNNFVRMGLKTEVLYNPKRDENGKAIDGQDKGALAEVNGGNVKSPEELKAERLEQEKALTAQKEAEAKIQKEKDAAEENAKKLKAERLEQEKALTAQKEAEAKIQKEKDAAEENAKKLKDSKPIREITVNNIVFEVFQNSAKTLYTAKQKDGGPITAKGKTLAELNEDLKTNTNI